MHGALGEFDQKSTELALNKHMRCPEPLTRVMNMCIKQKWCAALLMYSRACVRNLFDAMLRVVDQPQIDWVAKSGVNAQDERPHWKILDSNGILYVCVNSHHYVFLEGGGVVMGKCAGGVWVK